MSETFIVMFNDVSSYEKYKTDVVTRGGTIKNDLGSVLMGFTAVIPPTLLAIMQSSTLTDNGISTIERDSVVTIQT